MYCCVYAVRFPVWYNFARQHVGEYCMLVCLGEVA